MMPIATGSRRPPSRLGGSVSARPATARKVRGAGPVALRKQIFRIKEFDKRPLGTQCSEGIRHNLAFQHDTTDGR
jgi:hypothetical protein